VDFDDTPEEVAFRAGARSWLSAHAKLRSADTAPPVTLTEAFSEEEQEHIRQSKRWQATLYDGGWAGITWPKEHGGRGGTPIQAAIFAQEQAAFDVPDTIFAQGIGMGGPALMAHGSQAQKDRFLPPMLRGDEVWCQLFSEPGSGSDLASLATRAERDGDHWIVNGQKVWTSSAHFSDWGILLARTGEQSDRHRGISYFLLDMRSPGVEVRPIHQMTGGSHFCEVFFADVAVPHANLVGEINGGWAVTMTTLTSERTLISNLWEDRFAKVYDLARQTSANTDPLLRQRLAQAHIRSELIKYLGWRQQTAMSRGTPAGPESSVAKLALSLLLGEIGDLIMALRGTAGTVTSDDPHLRYLDSLFLGQWSSRIGGGTEQIQRNIIGERLLGLPREPNRVSSASAP
jgi:alkylation response protein AidB-like acyl-CoA dehydrogenase